MDLGDGSTSAEFSVDKIEAAQIFKQKELLKIAQSNAVLLKPHELSKVLFYLLFLFVL